MIPNHFVYTTSEVAKLFHIKPIQIYIMAKHFNIGHKFGTYRFTKQDIERINEIVGEEYKLS